MPWNWQKPDWPVFSWDHSLLRKAEEHFLIGSGMFVGTIKHLDAIDHERLTIEAISLEALTTSEIERGDSGQGQRSIIGTQTAWRGYR